VAAGECIRGRLRVIHAFGTEEANMRIRTRIITSLAIALLAPAGVIHAGDSPAPEATPSADAKPEKKEAVKKDEPVCTTAPGSRVRAAKPAECRKLAKQPYRSWSKDDLDSTGESNVADALRRLDPSIQ
jgi:hypothetical protein